MKDIVAIIGSHPRTRNLFDFNRTDCDIWVFNEVISNKVMPHADAVFQLHAEAIWRNPANRNDPGHFKWLTMQKEADVYMQDIYPDVPRSKKYPLEGVKELLNGDPDHFLSSSIAEAIGLAVYLGIYKKIEVYGVAMETNTEYQFQREGVAFWKGFAMGRGIDFFFADHTYRTPVYGYEGAVTLPYERFDERISELMPEIEKVSELYKIALSNTQMALTQFANNGSLETENNIYSMVDKQRQLGERLGILDGAKQENERYKKKADTMRASAGNFLFSRQEFESAAKKLTDKTSQAQLEFVSLGTKLEIVHQNLKNAAKGSPKRKGLVELYIQTVQLYLQANNQAAIYQGAANENFNYMGWLDKHIRAAGGSKSEAILLEALQNA